MHSRSASARCWRVSRPSRRRRATSPGGLPRVAELFEARSPKDAGMLAEVTGTVTFGKETKGKQRLIITDLDGKEHEFLITKDKHLLVHDGQVVNRGESDRRRSGRSARHPAPARRRGTRALHRRRGAGRLPPAGGEDQRQAHRGDRAADAASGADHAIRATRHSSPANRSSARNCSTRTTRRSPTASGRRCTTTSCLASPRPRCRPTRSSPPHRSRRPRASSPRPRSWARRTICVG